jgi:predicted acylesterase/phospholipase RssA
MPPTTSAPVTEHRLAVVMNGGVSLAVWMGGVACELDTLRRASAGLSGPPVGPADASNARTDAELKLFALWREHAAAASVQVTVDVIAGTSAGGLNGVLLATAIANGAPLTGLRQLWMTAAQLAAGQLLKPQPGGAASVLNGDYFLEQITAAIASLQQQATGEVADVALTVTSTALRGQPRIAYDRTGAAFTEPDHRRRFDFRRAGRQFSFSAPDGYAPVARNDFGELPALAHAARASASFPVAFQPVGEIPELRARRSWPTWNTGPDLEWLADGGILDNSPFEPVLQAIADQPVERTWQRTLCYVVPSAAEATLGDDITTPPSKAALPPPWTSVLSAAIGLPSEADFRDDLEQLHDLIRAGRSSYDVRRFRSLIAPGSAPLRAEGVALATGGFGLYRQARAAAAIYEVRDAVATADPSAYLDPVTDVDPAQVTGSHPWLPDAFPTALPTTWTWGLAASGRLVAVLLRSLADRTDAPDELRRSLAEAQAKITAIRAAVQVQWVGATLPLSGPDVVSATAALADASFATLGVPAALGALITSAVTEFAAGWPDGGVTPVDVLQAALCIEVVNGAGGVPAETKPAPIFDFIRMGISQMPAVFQESAAAADDTLLQQTGRPSSASNILYGTRLDHFGAFGRESWREWDWMWGRLNAAVHLGGLLGLTSEQIDELAEQIVLAEGRTVEDVNAEIGFVVAATGDNLIDAMKQDGLVRPATDALFALLGSTRPTEPAVPGAVRWVAALGARVKPPGLSVPQRAARGATGLARRLLYRKLNS